MITKQPPLPHDLRERFKNYPDYVAQLEEALARVVSNPAPGLDTFERAIWALEATLQVFNSEARTRLGEAKTEGDPVKIARADDELLYMLHSGNPLNYDLSVLQDYFGAQRKALP